MHSQLYARPREDSQPRRILVFTTPPTFAVCRVLPGEHLLPLVVGIASQQEAAGLLLAVSLDAPAVEYLIVDDAGHIVSGTSEERLWDATFELA